jgi:hypothetical protein
MAKPMVSSGNNRIHHKVAAPVLSPSIQSVDPVLTAEEPGFASPINLLHLQRLVGNQATRGLLSKPIVQSVSAPTIQRNPQEIARIEKEIQERKSKEVPAGKARQRNNAQIRKLEEQLEALKGAPAPTPEVTPEPEAPKEPTYAEKYPDLAGSFDELEIKAMVDGLTDGGIKTLLTKFSAAELKLMYVAFGAVGINALPGQFGMDTAVLLVKNLTALKLKDLMSAYSEGQIKTILTQLGIDPLKDIMNTFTGAEFKAYVGTVGAPRLNELLLTYKLKATALKKYTAAWLKTFVGANQSTMNHLLGISQKGDGVISGGHDDEVFTPFLDAIVDSYTFENDEGEDETYDMSRGRVTNSYSRPKYEKVFYTTHRVNEEGDDQEDWASGSKTLITDLQSKQADWLKLANEAIWNAIKAETFDPNVSAWTGRADDGTNMNGFYNKPKVAVDTFFPV